MKKNKITLSLRNSGLRLFWEYRRAGRPVKMYSRVYIPMWMLGMFIFYVFASIFFPIAVYQVWERINHSVIAHVLLGYMEGLALLGVYLSWLSIKPRKVIS